MILDIFLKIGFRFFSYDEPGAGKAYEYKYYPDYLDDKHYTLIVFKVYYSESLDWRLYVHNTDGSFNDSIFQISDGCESNINFIYNKIYKTFVLEMRDIKLQELGL